MDSENEKRPQKERAPKPPKEPRQKETRAKEPREARDKKEKEQRRRERPIEASEVFVAAEESSNDIFRKRLPYLMNGTHPQGKAVTIQEWAAAGGAARPAIRKYLKPKGAPTTPSAATVCAIARYFGTTPDFLLGFDEPDTEAARKALESDYYNALGLNQRTIDLLRALRERQGDERASAGAAALMSMLDRQVAAFAEDALRLLEDRS